MIQRLLIGLTCFFALGFASQATAQQGRIDSGNRVFREATNNPNQWNDLLRSGTVRMVNDPSFPSGSGLIVDCAQLELRRQALEAARRLLDDLRQAADRELAHFISSLPEGPISEEDEFQLEYLRQVAADAASDYSEADIAEAIAAHVLRAANCPTAAGC